MKFPEDYSFDQFILSSQNQPHFDQPQVDQNPPIDLIPGTKTEGEVPHEAFHYVEEQLAQEVFESVIIKNSYWLKINKNLMYYTVGATLC